VNVPPEGTTVWAIVEFLSADDRADLHRIPLDGLGTEWKTYSVTLIPRLQPIAATVRFQSWFETPDPSTVWIDDVKLSTHGSQANLLANGDFESAQLLEGQLDGIYLDTMESYLNNLNYRREHWRFTNDPLTFDFSRRPALHQLFSHVSYARRISEWARQQGMIVFGNCSPHTPFGAPYLDVMGGEEYWAPNGKYTPRSDADFCFVRFMCRGKPFCLLQYSDLSCDQIQRYVKRCLFYGVFPGNQSKSPTSGRWYWVIPLELKGIGRSTQSTCRSSSPCRKRAGSL